MIDPATGWFKMAQIRNKTAAEITDITEKNWFTLYPHDSGTGKFKQGIINDATDNISTSHILLL